MTPNRLFLRKTNGHLSLKDCVHHTCSSNVFIKTQNIKPFFQMYDYGVLLQHVLATHTSSMWSQNVGPWLLVCIMHSSDITLKITIIVFSNRGTFLTLSIFHCPPKIYLCPYSQLDIWPLRVTFAMSQRLLLFLFSGD